jgi:hypothetical protein
MAILAVRTVQVGPIGVATLLSASLTDHFLSHSSCSPGRIHPHPVDQPVSDEWFTLATRPIGSREMTSSNTVLEVIVV